MRPPRGVLLPPLGVRDRRPRRGDVHRTLMTALFQGTLPPGARLPSTRQAAIDYGVSRGLIEEVFAQLTDEGCLERHVGRGTFVAQTMSRFSAGARTHAAPRIEQSLSRRGRALSNDAACREPERLLPFNAGVADVAEFPWSIWQRLANRGVRELGRASLGFADPRGLPQLRRAVAGYLAQSRGMRCTMEQIVVFNSAQQAINALVALLLDRGETVWMEDPGYSGARAAFTQAGARVIPIPVDADGLCVDAGLRTAPAARLAYVTPSNQYPTGVALSLERRAALVAWAARRRAWIIEDDYDGELRYDGQPLTPARSIDSHGRVLYVGTFNKSMFVSLRLAFAVVPDTLVEPLANARTQMDGFTPAVQQMGMSLFMEEGHFAAHLRRMRAAYRAKRNVLVDTLAPLAAHGWTWPTSSAGMHVLLAHRDGDYVRAIARASACQLALLSSYRRTRARGDGLFLRFGGLDLATVAAGAKTLVTEITSDAHGLTIHPASR